MNTYGKNRFREVRLKCLQCGGIKVTNMQCDVGQYEFDCELCGEVTAHNVVEVKPLDVVFKMSEPRDGFCWCDMCGFVREVKAEYRAVVEQDYRCPDCEGVGDASLLCVEDELPDYVIPDEPMLAFKPRERCWLCGKRIRGKVRYQGGSLAHPCHSRCIVRPAAIRSILTAFSCILIAATANACLTHPVRLLMPHATQFRYAPVTLR